MFIAIDGEGIGDKLILLCATNEDRTIERNIESLDGLTTVECLEFLWTLAEDYPDNHYIGFSFSYDVNMILFPLLHKSVAVSKKLAKQKRLRVQIADGLHLDVRLFGRKMTILKEYVETDGRKTPGRSIKIDDVFGFYQSSFVKALQKEGMIDADAMARIEEGKKHRAGQFDDLPFETVKEYCFTECQQLAQIVHKLSKAIESAGIQQFNNYHGAGALAQSFMMKYHVRDHVVHDKVYGDEIETIIRNAYFGGRTECFKQGYFPLPSYQYDINSAYPTETLKLPSLRGGQWLEYRGPSDQLIYKLADSPYAIAHVEWDIGKPTVENNMVPFPVRYDDGTIHYIRNGKGWYWTPETLAALRNFGDAIKLDRLLVFEPAEVVPNNQRHPFYFVENLARLRFQAKANGLASEKVYKLGLNSLYGKTAQKQFGARIPTFQSYVWAGLITAGTRGRILDMIAPNNDLVIAVATDGVLFTDDPLFPTSSELGGLDRKEYHSLLYLQPGVYFCDGKQGIPKTRGHLMSDLNYDDILHGWQDNGPAYEYEYVSRRFVAMGLANHWNRWEDWCQWLDFSRTVKCGIRDKMPADCDYMFNPHLNPSQGGSYKPTVIHDGRPTYNLVPIDPPKLRGFHSVPFTNNRIAEDFTNPSRLDEFLAGTQPSIPTLF